MRERDALSSNGCSSNSCSSNGLTSNGPRSGGWSRRGSLHAALDYVRRGWQVVPCSARCPDTGAILDAPGKMPRLRWRDGGLSTEEDVRRVWRETDGVALLTGHSGLVVLDCDVDEWRQIVRALEGRLGALDRRCVVVTGSGRVHIYCRAPAARIASRAPMRLYGAEVAGIDVRGAGGIVVAPGSIHPRTGLLYRWALPGDDDSPPPSELPELPDAWVAALAWQPEARAYHSAHRALVGGGGDRARRFALGALRHAVERVVSAPSGTRNTVLRDAAYSLGGLLASGALTEGEIASALDAACSSWRDRTSSKDRSTIERAMRAGESRPRAPGGAS